MEPQPELKKIGSIRMVRGLRLYSVDATGTVEEVSIAHGRRVTIEDGKRYCQALNLKNATRKFQRS